MRWHLDEVFVRINGKCIYLWRARDCEGEVLDILVQSLRNKQVVMENWLYATNASMGTIARRHDFNYAQSIRTSQRNPIVNELEVRGDVNQQITEHMALVFYRRRAQYLDGENWNVLMGKGDERFAAHEAAE